ncbi:MAG TPA: TIGR00282 family metallophosphoesterase [Paracoccaceae bacterium]|nr:TIGR00282 family metallophosphoesterase [Paracoccaceae bacterium]
MRILFLGDVVGRTGRNAIVSRLKGLRADWRLDFVVVNGENATGGMGLSGQHAKLLLDAGVDCLTLGDHAFDQRDMMTAITQDKRIIRPLNYAPACPGVGVRVFETATRKRVLVAQALGQVFMKRPFSDPFSALDAALKQAPLGKSADAVVVDFHAEATSEKVAMGHWLDGRASLVVGTHTHVPTADTQILESGTAVQSDAGMCGDYDSVIGMEKLEPMRRFVTGMASGRFTPANGEATLSGVFVETNDATGLAKSVSQVRVGGRLSQSGPAE